MRKLKGTVISNKMARTLVVRVDTLKRHPKYQKFYRTSKKFKAHVVDALGTEGAVGIGDAIGIKGTEANGGYRVGDIVIIMEMRPLSREKRWRVIELVKRRTAEEEDEANTL